MAQEEEGRLSAIHTVWEEVRQAHGDGTTVQAAQESLFQRYGGAARRYLLVALGDANAAEDLVQDFGVALIEGRLRRADPSIGRFRDYVKGVLFRLVREYRRRRQRWYQRLWPFGRGSQDAKQFDQDWRDELLARSWARLAEMQPDYFAVLHHRAGHPDQPIDDMSRELAPQLGRAVNPENLRQMLHRARKAFAHVVLTEVSASLTKPTVEAVQQELLDLDLLKYFPEERR